MTRLTFLGALLGALGTTGCSSGPPVPVYQVADRGGDRDQDGAADIDDACADEPEDGLPPKANDGCPADDPDRDGVARASDRCPNSKEDGAPPNPSDGCPSSSDDADGDGVADAGDRCPDQREDNLDPDPNDGCPAADADNDGIADVRDGCPSEPETLNGYRDDDGCPDTGGGEIVFDETSHEIYFPENQQISFEKDKADISPAGLAVVDKVAQVLNEHPEIERAEIEGHASTVGDAGYNRVLTELRAIAVANALVTRGVAGRRLVAIGYGEFCPVVDSGDEIEEPKNRRVAIKAVVIRGIWQSVQRGCWRAKAAGIDPTERRPGVFAPPRPPAPPPSGPGGPGGPATVPSPPPPAPEPGTVDPVDQL
ncbi:MAG: OmpA family protein [Myxococcota bacterium]